jgi:hypothetical protein
MASEQRQIEVRMFRRLLSLAPQPPSEALVTIASGIGLWVVALATPRPEWAPNWSGWVITVLGWLLIGRGVIGGLYGFVSVIRRVVSPTGWPGNRAPSTDSEVDDLLAKRPVGWEFYLMAGYLRLGRERVEPNYLDHELRYRPPVTERVSDSDVITFIQTAHEDALRVIANLKETTRREVQERAYGPPGTAGDPERIKHLAARWTGFYADLLGWAARLRALGVSERYRRIVDLQTGIVDGSIRAYRAFVDEFVDQVDGPMTDAIKSKASWTGDMTIVLDIDDETLSAIDAEIARLISES